MKKTILFVFIKKILFLIWWLSAFQIFQVLRDFAFWLDQKWILLGLLIIIQRWRLPLNLIRGTQLVQRVVVWSKCLCGGYLIGCQFVKNENSWNREQRLFMEWINQAVTDKIAWKSFLSLVVLDANRSLHCWDWVL